MIIPLPRHLNDAKLDFIDVIHQETASKYPSDGIKDHN